jgi:hypothetical protein
MCTLSLFAQNTVVSGTVVDTSGSPLQGVTVAIKGTSSGILSDVNGKYSISVSSAENILGFAPQMFAPDVERYGTVVYLF